MFVFLLSVFPSVCACVRLRVSVCVLFLCVCVCLSAVVCVMLFVCCGFSRLVVCGRRRAALHSYSDSQINDKFFFFQNSNSSKVKGPHVQLKLDFIFHTIQNTSQLELFF